MVPGCGETRLLEIDHWRIPFAYGGETRLGNLCRVCRAHHRMKTDRGFVLEGGPGQWRWRVPRVFRPPGEPDWPRRTPDEAARPDEVPEPALY